MKPTRFAAAASALFGLLCLGGCGEKPKADPAAEAPPAAQVVEQGDQNAIKVDRPERYELVEATRRQELSQLRATGTITPDVEHSVPVVSLASGRALAIYAKLGDDVRKGQLLLKVQSNDVANGLQTYQQAKADEQLARTQLERAKLLYDKGAIALNDLQIAQDTEEKARVALDTSGRVLRNIGADPNQTEGMVNIYAPVSGTVVEQNVVQSASVHTPDNQPNLFTIADLSTVWALCDVYENDLGIVRLGDKADVVLSAFPDRTFHGKISNIGKVLDTNTRSAKVRIVLSNPGLMRIGMFVTATFFGDKGENVAVVPAGSVLHLHDRDWVFMPTGNGAFRRVEIRSGKTLDGNLQIVMSGLQPGQKIVKDALALNSEGEQ